MRLPERFIVALVPVGLTVVFSLLAANRESPRVEFEVAAPQNATFAFTSNSGPMALSHDGTRLVFIATSAGGTMLWLRTLASDVVRPIMGTEGGHYPFWSPDGRYLAFFSDGKLKKVSMSANGSVQTLCEAPMPRGGTWNRQGTIVFASGASEPLRSISSSGGRAIPVTRLDEKADEYSHRFPWFFPDGRHFLYLCQFSSGPSHSVIYAGSLGSTEKMFIVSANSPALYSRHGYVLFLRGLTLMARRFDLKRLQVAGEAEPIANGVQYFPNTASAILAVADDGTVAFHRGPGRMARLVWVDRSGKELGEIAVSGNAQFPRIARHADRIVYSLADPATGAGDLWIVDTTRNVPSQFTSEPGDDLWPAWSPDDSEIAYSGNGARGSVEILVKPSNGKRAASTLYASPTVKFVNDWSRDGRHILFQQIERQSKTGFDLYALDVDKKAASAVVQTQYNEWGATFSPDGQWIAYGSDRSGRNELYVQLFPGTGPGLQISTRGGSEPQWSEDGKDIYFRSGDDSLCRIDIRTTPVFHVSDAVTLFPLRARWLNIGGPQWQVADHGNKFLLAELIPEEAPAPITVLR